LVDPKKLLIKNIFSNWAMMAVSIAIAFFMSPFLVHNLGKEQYGIWALVLSIIGYSSFLDAGMRQSLARFIPKYYAVKDYVKLNQVLSTTNAIYFVTGMLVIVGTLIIAFFFAHFFKVSEELLPIMKIVLILIGFNEAMRFFFITRSALGPFHRYDIGNIIDIMSTIGNALVIVYFISRGYSLITLAIITVATSLIKFTIRSVYQKRLVPEVDYRIKHVDKETFKELFEYGAVSFFIVVAWMVIFNSDNVVIGMFLSTTDVTYFSIAGMMINYLRTLINAIGIPLVPAISHFDASSDREQIAALYTKLSRYLNYLTACIAIGILFFGDRFIGLWMGEGFGPTVKVLYILIIPASIYLPQVAANSVLLGISRHRTLFKMLAVEATAKITLSVILVKPLGIFGVALGTAIPQFIIYLFIYPRIFSKIIGLKLKVYYITNLKIIMAASILTVPLSFILRFFNMISGWLGFIISVAIVVAVAAAGFWLRVLEPEDKARIADKLNIVKGRFK
jgi:O-antigen/teichoic acid export membrane protein